MPEACGRRLWFGSKNTLPTPLGENTTTLRPLATSSGRFPPRRTCASSPDFGIKKAAWRDSSLWLFGSYNLPCSNSSGTYTFRRKYAGCGPASGSVRLMLIVSLLSTFGTRSAACPGHRWLQTCSGLLGETWCRMQMSFAGSYGLYRGRLHASETQVRLLRGKICC